MSPRIAPLEPPYDARIAEDLARLMPPGMDPLGLFCTLARNPRVLRRIRRGGLLDPGSITLRQREIVILRTTARAGAEYEWGVHVAFFGDAAGFDAAQRHAVVWLGSDAPCWQRNESILVRVCDELHETSAISDATWSAMRESFADDQIVEILVLAGLYRMISYAVNGTRLELEAGAPRFPERAPESAGATHRGSCLCGGLRYEIDGPLGDFGYCHCRSCRKASGSSHGANAPVERARAHATPSTADCRSVSPGVARPHG